MIIGEALEKNKQIIALNGLTLAITSTLLFYADIKLYRWPTFFPIFLCHLRPGYNVLCFDRYYPGSIYTGEI